MSDHVTRLGYRELAVRYNLGTLPQGGDFQVDSTGDLKMTSDGGLQLGDDVHNALHRLVARWRLNVTTLKRLFDDVVESIAKKTQLEEELNRISEDGFGDHAAIERWHQIHDEHGSEEYGPEAYAGTIMVVLGAMLRREWADLRTPTTWNTAGSKIAGYSFGQIVEASANNFRHSDEWATAVTPDTRQSKSMRVIADVLSIRISLAGVNNALRENLCPEILLELSKGDFVVLMDGFFGYARSLAGLT